MQTQGIELLDLALSADPTERNRALWRVAQEVLKHLDAHYRYPSPEPSMPPSYRGATVESIQRAASADGPIGSAYAMAFGAYRNSILEFEGLCARRLDVLRGTARTLLKLREVAGAEHADPMLQHLADFVARHWRVDLGLDADRDWPLRVARRYDLLPPSWRYV